MLEISIFVPRKKRRLSFGRLQSLQKISQGRSCKTYCNSFLLHLLTSSSEGRAWLFLQLNDRNEAGILTARKDLDFIGREELLEALKRVSPPPPQPAFWEGLSPFPPSCRVWCLLWNTAFSFSLLCIFNHLQQKGTFETGQEDSKEIPDELKLRLAYREAATAVLACYFPDSYRPFIEVNGHHLTSVLKFPMVLHVKLTFMHCFCRRI